MSLRTCFPSRRLGKEFLVTSPGKTKSEKVAWRERQISGGCAIFWHLRAKVERNI